MIFLKVFLFPLFFFYRIRYIYIYPAIFTQVSYCGRFIHAITTSKSHQRSTSFTSHTFSSPNRSLLDLRDVASRFQQHKQDCAAAIQKIIHLLWERPIAFRCCLESGGPTIWPGNRGITQLENIEVPIPTILSPSIYRKVRSSGWMFTRGTPYGCGACIVQSTTLVTCPWGLCAPCLK